MPSAELIAYAVDPIHDCVTCTLQHDTGQMTGHTFRESQYLPQENWTTADLLAAVTASLEDHATVTLAASVAESDSALSAVKANADAARVALEAPPESADATLAEIAASINAHVEAAQRLQSVGNALLKAQQDADAARVAAEATATAARIVVEQAAEVERQKVARVAEDARIAQMVKEQVAAALAGSSAP